MSKLTPLQYLFWIALAMGTQLMLALWGILSRYLQTKPDMPAPALRLVLVISTLAETTLVLFHALPTAALKCYQQRRRESKAAADGKSSTEGPTSDGGSSLAADSSSHSVLVAAVHGAEVAAGAAELLALQQQQQQQRQAASLPTWQQPAAASAAGAAVAAAEAHGSPRHAASLSPPSLAAGVGSIAGAVVTVTPVASHGQGTESPLGSAAGSAAPLSSAAAAGPPANHTACPAAAHLGQKPPSGALGLDGYSSIDTAATAGTLPSVQPPPRSASSRLLSKLKLRRVQTFVRPEVAFPMRRGLSMRFEQLQSERPALTRYLALATLTVSFSATCGLQLCAPGFVDPSLVQLVGQFTAIGTALAQAVLLQHCLPWLIWPTSALMVGGAAMVIVPNMGHSEVGSLSSARGWLGFGLAVAALITTVIYFVTLQASRHMGYSATHLQHYFLTFSILVFLALSLPINGTDWKEQFGGWTAGQWLILAFESSIAYVGSAAAMQHCVWKLGASTVSLFFGLRLVFTVALTEPILGATIIKTGVQIAGVIITAGSVTGYVGWQWWQSRQKQDEAAA